MVDRQFIVRSIIFVLFGIFVYSTVTVIISTTSVISGTLLMGVFVIRICGKVFIGDDVCAPINKFENPLKGKPRNKCLSLDEECQIKNKIFEYVTYDAYEASCLQNFAIIKNNTPCIFAKRAEIWGSKAFDDTLTLEDNIYRSLPSLFLFTLTCMVTGLDGFVIELPGNKYCSDIKVFGKNVQRVLKLISDNDPEHGNSLKKLYIGKKGWVFEFNKLTMFVTTFAPFYPAKNSRYSFGCVDGYILLQPELSFAQHDLSPDTPFTNWCEPKTIRDKIRVAFRDAGQEYTIQETVYYPMSHDIVKPLERLDPVVEWWNS